MTATVLSHSVLHLLSLTHPPTHTTYRCFSGSAEQMDTNWFEHGQGTKIFTAIEKLSVNAEYNEFPAARCRRTGSGQVEMKIERHVFPGKSRKIRVWKSKLLVRYGLAPRQTCRVACAGSRGLRCGIQKSSHSQGVYLLFDLI